MTWLLLVLWIQSFTWILFAFDGGGAHRALLGITVGAVHMITVVLDKQTQVTVEGF